MKRAGLVIVLLGLATSLSHRVVEAYDPDGAAVHAIVQTIEQAGGHITHRFRHVNGLAAEVPDSALATLNGWWDQTTSDGRT